MSDEPHVLSVGDTVRFRHPSDVVKGSLIDRLNGMDRVGDYGLIQNMDIERDRWFFGMIADVRPVQDSDGVENAVDYGIAYFKLSGGEPKRHYVSIRVGPSDHRCCLPCFADKELS